MVIVAIVSITLSVLCLLYAIHVSIIYNTFNKNIKSWAESLDEATQEAIDRSARRILRHMDERITEQNEQLKNNKNNE